MCDPCPDPLERLQGWLGGTIGALAAERARQAQAATKRVARLLKKIARQDKAYQRASDAQDAYYKTHIHHRDHVPESRWRALDRLAARADGLKPQPDMDALLKDLETAYGLSLPPGYIMRPVTGHGPFAIIIEKVPNPSGILSSIFERDLASPATLALRFGAITELSIPGRLDDFGRGKTADALEAIQRHDWVLENAKRFGLTKDMVQDVETERQAAYDTLDYQTRRHVDEGLYKLAP